jgi:cell division protein FtsB
MSRPMMVQLTRIYRFFSQANRWPLLIACTLLVVLLGYTIFREGGILATLRLRHTQAKIESDNQRLREDNARLKSDVNDLMSNRKRIEAEARQLGLMYPDEVAVYWKLDNGATARAFLRPANPAKSAPKVGTGNRSTGIPR